MTFAGIGGIAVSAAGHTVTISTSAIPVPLCSFAAYQSVNAPNSTGDGSFPFVICDGVLYDISSNYDGTTGTFTAPSDGIYHFDAYISLYNITDQVFSDILITTTSLGFETDLKK